MEELHPYYINKEKKNMELVECWCQAIWYAIQISTIIFCSHYIYIKLEQLWNIMK